MDFLVKVLHSRRRPNQLKFHLKVPLQLGKEVEKELHKHYVKLSLHLKLSTCVSMGTR